MGGTFRLSLRPIVVVTRATLLDFANRRYLRWLYGALFLLLVGLAIVGRYFPLEGLTTQDKARLFATGTAGLYLLITIIVVGLAVIRPDIDSGAAALALTRPVSRAEYVLGRYLGAVLVLVTTILLMGAGSALIVLAAERTFDWTLVYAFVVMAVNGSVVLAVMTLLGIVAGTIGAAILGFVVYYVAGEIPLVVALVRDEVVTGFGANALRLFVAAMPHLLPSPLTDGQEVFISDTVVFTMRGPAWFDWLWALAWIVGSLALAAYEMRRREF